MGAVFRATVVSCVLLVAGQVAAGQAPQITSVGVLPGAPNSRVTALSADGTTAVGTSGTGAFRWTAATGIQGLGGTPQFSGAAATSVSADGSVVVGNSSTVDGPRGFRWTQGGGMLALNPYYAGTRSNAMGVSGNGVWIVGSTERMWHEFIIPVAAGWVGPGAPARSYGTPPGYIHYLRDANAASHDGEVVVGRSDHNRAFRVVDVNPEFLPSNQPSTAVGVSAGGARVVGHYTGMSRSFLWHYGVGEQDLGVLPGTGSTLARAISADGATIVGQAGATSFVWTEQAGIQRLSTFLTDSGVNLTGWLLTDATGVSGDGLTFAGIGTLNGLQRGWVATIPGPGAWLVPVLGAVFAIGGRRRSGCRPASSTR